VFLFEFIQHANSFEFNQNVIAQNNHGKLFQSKLSKERNRFVVHIEFSQIVKKSARKE
jgi:hypothetical protein